MDIADKPSKVLITEQDYFFKQEKNSEFYTDIELQNIRNIIPKLTKTDGKILFCLMTLGVRISEILELKTSAFIQNEDGSYYLNLGMDKVDREHIKPLTNEVAYIIKSEIEKNRKILGHEPEYVFLSDKGKTIGVTSLSKRINYVLLSEHVLDKDGKQLQFRSHKFRATVATTMLNAGYGEEATAKALGHRFCNPSSKKINNNMESKDTIIMTLRAKIKMLEQENSALKRDSQYKERCEMLEEKVKHLEEQLKNSYASNLDDDF